MIFVGVPKSLSNNDLIIVKHVKLIVSHQILVLNFHLLEICKGIPYIIS